MKELFKIWTSWAWAYIRPLGKILLAKGSKQMFEIIAAFIMEAEVNPALKTGAGRKAWVAAKIKESDLLVGDKYADMVIGIAIDLIVLYLTSQGKINTAKVLDAIL